jgi:uncharacterized protein (TIGR03437 family)
MLERRQVRVSDVATFVTHQANQNLIDRVARATEAPPERFYRNIRRYGNTSSASMLIAASEWRDQASLAAGDTVCFAAFGARFHWGACWPNGCAANSRRSGSNPALCAFQLIQRFPRNSEPELIAQIKYSVRHFCLGLISAFLCAANITPQLVVNTVAGGKIESGIPASEAVIGTIGGIARDPAGNIVFSENSRYVIRRIRSDGTIETIVGTGSSGYAGDGGSASKAVFTAPVSLQYDSAGNLFVVDGPRIRRIDKAGVITTVLGTGIYGSLGADGPPTSAQVGRISSIAIDANDNLYFAEFVPPNNANRIRRLTTSGHVELVAVRDLSCTYCGSTGDGGPASQATLSGLGQNLAFDRSGNLYLSDENYIRRISPDGTIDRFSAYGPSVSTWGDMISGLTFDTAGSLYIAASSPFAGSPAYIVRIASDGSVTTLAGGGKGQDGPALESFLNSISSPYADSSGNVFFTDHNRLRKLTPDATIETVAGGAPISAPDGTSATDAWLANPSAIALNKAGQVYIFEQATCLLRRIENDGRLSTIAGTGRCGTSNPSGPALSSDLPPTNQLAIDSTDRVYGAADFQVYSVSGSGQVATISGNAAITLPSIVVDSKDNLFLTAFLANGISRRSPDGSSQPLGFFAQQPLVRLGIDDADNLYGVGAASNGIGNIYEVLPAGYGEAIGTTPRSTLQYNPSFSITAQAKGYAWFTDGLFMNLYAPGFHETFGQIQGFSGDGGPAAAAYYSNPSSLSFAANGDLYLLDSGNNRVRRISGSPPSPRPSINAGGIVNSASFAAGAVAPGELVAIFGSNFGYSALQVAAPQNNTFPGVLSHTRVFFNGTPGAITAGAANQINVFVPYAVTGASVSIVVDVDGTQSLPVSVPLAPSAIGLYSANGTGSGQGAIVNQDGSINGSANPAVPGSVVSLYGTGEGSISPSLPDGALVLSTPLSKPLAAPITAAIGSSSATVLYAGSAPTLSAGVFQVNIMIPPGTPSGDVSITVSLGENMSASHITVAVL